MPSSDRTIPSDKSTMDANIQSCIKNGGKFSNQNQGRVWSSPFIATDEQQILGDILALWLTRSVRKLSWAFAETRAKQLANRRLVFRNIFNLQQVYIKKRRVGVQRTWVRIPARRFFRWEGYKTFLSWVQEFNPAEQRCKLPSFTSTAC